MIDPEMLAKASTIIWPDEEKRLAQILTMAQLLPLEEWIETVQLMYPLGLKVDGSMPWSDRGLRIAWAHVNRYYRRW